METFLHLNSPRNPARSLSSDSRFRTAGILGSSFSEPVRMQYLVDRTLVSRNSLK